MSTWPRGPACRCARCESWSQYLEDRPMTDFIESVTTEDVPWTVGGLDSERFTLRFPFSWKKQRYLFDRYVELQRRLRLQAQDARRARAASGQPVVVPDAADPVGDPARPDRTAL